jgi:hypothetical protein
MRGQVGNAEVGGLCSLFVSFNVLSRFRKQSVTFLWASRAAHIARLTFATQALKLVLGDIKVASRI